MFSLIYEWYILQIRQTACSGDMKADSKMSEEQRELMREDGEVCGGREDIGGYAQSALYSGMKMALCNPV